MQTRRDLNFNAGEIQLRRPMTEICVDVTIPCGVEQVEKQASELKMKTVNVAFPYALTGVPKGSRRVREMLVWGSTTAVIRMAAPAEMQVAFRVEFPGDKPLRYVLPDARRSTPPVILIRHYEETLWWPLKIDQYNDSVVLDLMHQLDSKYDDLLNMLPAGVAVSTVTPRPQMRSVEKDGLGLAEAFVQRTVYENLLICRNKVFVRGGAPVYVKNSFGRKRSWEIQAVDPGPDRAARTVNVGLRTKFDFYTDWWVQDAFRKGLLWRADMHEVASAAAHSMQNTMPTIETFSDEAPAEDMSLVVLDALFRETLLWAEECPQLHPFIDRLALGLEETTDEDTNTRRRVALCDFFNAIDDMDSWPKLAEIQLLLERLERAYWATYRFASEDYEALSSLRS
jgi:hypothetical protein